MRMLKTSSTPVSMTIGIARLASLRRRARATSNPSERWSIMTSSTTMSGGAAAIAASASRPFAAVRTSYRVSSTADASSSTSRTDFFAMALSPEPSDSVDRVGRADRQARAAVDAELLVDDVEVLDLARDRSRGARLGAQGAAAARLGDDGVGQQRLALSRWASSLQDVGIILGPEVAEGGEHRVGGRLPEAAQRRVLDVPPQRLEGVEVRRDGLALGDALEQVEHHAGADAAWRALAARLLDEELEEEARQLDHAGAVVEDDEPAGAHDRTELLQRLIVDRHVGGGGRDAAAGGPSRLGGFEAAAVRDAAADFLDDGAQRDAHRHLDETGVADRPGEGEHLGALAAARADGGEPLGAAQEDRRDAGPRLDVVDQCRLAPEAVLRRERRARLRRAALALDRAQQRRLLAADESARPDADLDVEAEPRAEDVLPEQAGAAGAFVC